MIEIILALALQLLIAAQQPNVPEITKNQAISLAMYAIEVAQEERAKQAVIAPVVAPVYIAPVQPAFSAIIPPMVENVDKSALVIGISEIIPPRDINIAEVPYGSWYIKVEVLDSAGKHVKFAPYEAYVDGVIQTNGTQSDGQGGSKPITIREANNITNENPTDYFGIYAFTPKEEGTYTVKITSGEKSDYVTVVVSK